ncbi:MAG: peptidoglycan bridge formation glycyltransferase FemA/FemB family protein [Anaerolineales bacterium]
MTILSKPEWDCYIQLHPEAHLLQNGEWGELKVGFGWDVARVKSESGAGAQILFRRLPGGLSFGYIPKGPIGTGWDNLWYEVDRLCIQKRSVFLKVEPDAWEPVSSEIKAELPGFIPSISVQPRRTLLISLEGGEEDWLMRMGQKTRYNIRLAQKKGVRVEQSDDVEDFYQLMKQTGERDNFGVHSREYYQRAFELFVKKEQCVLLFARYEKKLLAALMAFASGSRAWYFYGASGDLERQRMPAYLLQWEAMRWAARRGCLSYDLWGVPDYDEDELESQFTRRSDGLWGVYRFKRGFGGELLRSVGAWDRVYKPGLYRFYLWWLKRTGRLSGG